MFGALISAVDPVATLSILGNAELNVDPLLYSLIFGESVLNDAIAICLFKTFFKYYNPDGPDWRESEIPRALLSFITVSGLSIGVGVTLGLLPSYLYRHSQLNKYPSLETSLLFCFCYLCYAFAEAIGLSGIMALFFQSIILSHYNSYNLSPTAHVASEQIFSCLSTLTETSVFVYMGMGVFTGRFQNWSFSFSFLALLTCLIGRFFNIFPLSVIANLCRKGSQKLSLKMQVVLWFAGLRGAIAFALSENMPGPNKETYATTTLSICIFTTCVCGGFTDKMLTIFEMKEEPTPELLSTDADATDWKLNRLTYRPKAPTQNPSRLDHRRQQIREGIKTAWERFDNQVLRPHFGGESSLSHSSGRQRRANGDGSGNYELSSMLDHDDMNDNDDISYNGDEDDDSAVGNGDIEYR